MVTHYPPARLRHNSGQPTAITNVLVATSGSFSTGEIPLGAPTCSARSRRPVVVDPGADLVQASHRLLAQRYHQPARPPHPPVSQPARCAGPVPPIPLPDPSRQPTPAQAA
jgi:hypothetical protein